jgi:hypothetical protein
MRKRYAFGLVLFVVCGFVVWRFGTLGSSGPEGTLKEMISTMNQLACTFRENLSYPASRAPKFRRSPNDAIEQCRRLENKPCAAIRPATATSKPTTPNELRLEYPRARPWPLVGTKIGVPRVSPRFHTP